MERYAHGAGVVTYLARYLRGGPLKNARLVAWERDRITFALAWEGDAYAQRFPGTDLLWLESGVQEACLLRPDSDVNMFAEGRAHDLLRRYWEACLCPPKPRSKEEIIDRVWRTLWGAVDREPPDFARDARWANAICERSAGLCDGWIAVVVGWAHAEPEDENQQLRLRGLLLSQGFSIHPVRLGP
jgi:hypothetical protein